MAITEQAVQPKIVYPDSDGQPMADGDLIEIDAMSGWVSPRMGVRFDLIDGELELYYPDGRKFASYLELVEQAEQSQQQAEQAQDRLVEQAEQARQQIEQSQQQAAQAQARAERLAAQLRALGVEPE